MDYKELMCGDWVKVEQITEVINAKVLGVYKDGINYEVDYSGVKATNQIHTDYVSPIKLTEEILVKNGFDKDERSRYFHVYTLDIKGSYDFDICWSSVNGFNYEGDVMLTYVHQLQHLMRLCGIEKSIIL